MRISDWSSDVCSSDLRWWCRRRWTTCTTQPASCTTPATTCMASCRPMEARHDASLAAVSAAVGPAGADLAGDQPEPVAGHDPARRRARPAAGSGIRTAAAAQGARPQLPAGGAAADAGGVRHRALEPDHRPAQPARRRRRPLRIRRHPADAHQPPRPGRAGLHHHLDAWHHLGQLRPDRQHAADPRPGPGRRAGLDRHDPAAIRASPAGDLPMSHELLAMAIMLAQVLLLLAMGFSIVRMVRGPRAQDRVVALDALYVNAMILLLTIGIRTGSLLYVEAGLIIALLGFASTVALSKFLMRGWDPRRTPSTPTP